MSRSVAARCGPFKARSKLPTESRHLEFLSRLNESQLEDLWRLYQCEWWTQGRKLEDVRRAVKHSGLIFAFAEPGGRLVAFARVLTDFVYKALVLDVIVDREHRQRGIGRTMLDAIVSHPALANVRDIELYCRPELVPFYQKWTFTADLGELRFMRRSKPSR
jgi:GNAT superfamily N-acetyltransferase